MIRKTKIISFLLFITALFFGIFLFSSCSNPTSHDHDPYSLYVIKPATCTETGIDYCICLICGEYYEETTPTAAHDYSLTKTIKEATCVKGGIKRHKCKNCDNYYDETTPVSVVHDYSKTTVIEKATCTKDGKVNHKCKYCNAAYDETVPMHHSLDHTKHCSGCDYFEYFNCAVSVNTPFGILTQTLPLEYGKKFTLAPLSYMTQLKADRYYKEKLTTLFNGDGESCNVYLGESNFNVTADVYYEITTPQDFYVLQNDPLLQNYFSNQEKTDSLEVRIKNDIDFKNVEWEPVTINGDITLNGNNHSIKNYYSTKGGIFKKVGSENKNTTIKNLTFENANLNITKFSANVSSEVFYPLGILANELQGNIDGCIAKSGTINVNQTTNTDLGVGGICGFAYDIKNCKNYIDVTTNTAIASGIVILSNSISNCINYGKVTSGEVLISPNLIQICGTSGICNYTNEINNCFNYGEIYCVKNAASGISIYSGTTWANYCGIYYYEDGYFNCYYGYQETIQKCGNYANVTATNGDAVGIIHSLGLRILSQCFNRGKITASDNASGIISSGGTGITIGSPHTCLSNCYNTGDISGKEYASGIAISVSNQVIKNCYNAGTISGRKISGIVTDPFNTTLFKCVHQNDKFSYTTCNVSLCKVHDFTDTPFVELEYDTTIWSLNGDGKPSFVWEKDYEE